MADDATKHTPEPWEEGYNAPLQVARGGRVIGSFRRAVDREHANNCVNHCAGINPKSVPKMLLALRRIFATTPDRLNHTEDVFKIQRSQKLAEEAIALAEKQ